MCIMNSTVFVKIIKSSPYYFKVCYITLLNGTQNSFFCTSSLIHGIVQITFHFLKYKKYSAYYKGKIMFSV